VTKLSIWDKHTKPNLGNSTDITSRWTLTYFYKAYYAPNLPPYMMDINLDYKMKIHKTLIVRVENKHFSNDTISVKINIPMEV
jgi:hypothetical protein